MAARSVSRRVTNSTPMPGDWPASGKRRTQATRAWVDTGPAPGTSNCSESDSPCYRSRSDLRKAPPVETSAEVKVRVPAPLESLAEKRAWMAERSSLR